jgi:hypothetical protein
MGAGPAVRPARGAIGGALPSIAITDVRAAPQVTATSSQISYTLSAPATVTASLVDATGLTVATLFSESKPVGKQTFTFTVSPSVADGAYTIRLLAVGSDGRQAVGSVLVQVDHTVGDFSAAPAAISPNGDGIQDAVAISFNLARTSSATLELVRDGKPVATITSGAFSAFVPFATSWDATIDGYPIPDGTYQLALDVGGARRTLPLTIDRRAPVLRPISWTHLRFSVNEPVTVTLTAAGNSYVKRLKTAGRVYFWLKRLPRRYVLTAQDTAGNVAKLRRT